MAFNPVIAAVRFGAGRRPGLGDPVSVAAMLSRLAGRDAMASAYPIDKFEVLVGISGQIRKFNRMKATGEASREEMQAKIKELRRAEYRRFVRSFQATLARSVDTRDGLRERLTRFWADHFTTVGKTGFTKRAVSLYVEEAIRPNLTGRFADLLIAAVTHPMMLIYLDQVKSVGPNSAPGKRSGRGLNENLAREVLELHTLGVDGAYTQVDVRQLAELFTGLWVKMGEGFVFAPRFSEPGAEEVLGKRYGGTRVPKLADIHAALEDIAAHPDTARHIARKLAVHFVADEPPTALVDHVAARFRETDGDLMQVYTALLEHPAAFEGPLRKAKQPIDFVTSAIRALGVPGRVLTRISDKQAQRFFYRPMWQMGQRWEEPLGPDGWPEDREHWITPQGLAARIGWAMALQKVPELELPDPRQFVDDALGPLASERLRFTAGAAETRGDGVGVVLASPDFQLR